ncbi:conserved exported hypothetical protein [Desulfamplus magnetovallimortis]|uniref:Uncharacterized protein n=1 Tax=Desulfamplus magnetovallimortis TaxID=1246637 RepID=A0A1W1H6M8_9BACT|nr:hypothetical protein [Desulfamplus magnetovallimortis]SLM28094.1 conserved exported hypothetical protein [Desulfamplus magnetovallimortis]
MAIYFKQTATFRQSANRHKKILSALFSMVFIILLSVISHEAEAAAITSTVRVIHATSDTPFMDPGLKDLGHELQSVFKYTSYRLISSRTLAMAEGSTGRVSLPGDRSLELIPKGVENNRIRFSIRILKNDKQVFTTEIQLRNNSTITIGGPDFKNGYLLFNISGKTK